MPASNALPPVAGQAPAAATAATVTLAAVAGQAWVLSQIAWSYSAAPTGGSLTIAWGSVSMVFAIIAGGPSQLVFPDPLRLPTNTAVIITLASGGGSVVGTVYPLGYTD
jgi:hypothetical protein